MISEQRLEAHDSMSTSSGNAADVDDAAKGGERYARIEQVAARTGLTKRTLRYYEEFGLLAPPTRTEGGYRLYSEEDVAQLERIKRLRDLLGFSLKEIREISQAEEQRAQVRAAWPTEHDPRTRLALLDKSDALLRRQLELVEEKIRGLEEMRANVLRRLESHEQRRHELNADIARQTSESC